MARVSLNSLKEYDVVQLTNVSPFVRQNRTYTHAVICDIVYASQQNDRIAGLQVFEIVPVNEVPEGAKNLPLPRRDQGYYGLDVNQQWAVLIRPVSIPLASSVKQLERKGELVPEDRSRVEQAAGRLDIGEKAPGAPNTRDSFDYSTIANAGPAKSDTRSSLDRSSRVGAGSGPRGERAPTFEGMVVDLPLEFAAQALDLDPRIVAALTKPREPGLPPVKFLRDAWQMAQQQPDLLSQYLRVPALMDMTIAQAIEAGQLENTPALGYVTEPLGGARPLTTFRELHTLINADNGAGLSGYLGLANRQSKSRIKLIEAVNAACQQVYGNTGAPAENVQAISTETASSALQTAQSKLMGDYLATLSRAIGTQDYDSVPAGYMDGDRPVVVMRPASHDKKAGRPRLQKP